MRPALEYASSIWSPLASSTSINKLQVMQNAALRTSTGCTQETNIQHLYDETLILPIQEHLQLHNTNKNTTSITPLTQTYNILQHSKANKSTIFNNGRYTTMGEAQVIAQDRHRWRRDIVVPTTTAYKWWNCQVLRPANCCQHILPNRLQDGFPDPSQFAAAKLTHYSSKPQRPSDSSRSWQRILLSGDVHPNPGPTTKYPCPVCARNVTSRGVSYLCNRCSGWVHSKCSGLQNAAEYRRIKDWVCSSCNSNTSCR